MECSLSLHELKETKEPSLIKRRWNPKKALSNYCYAEQPHDKLQNIVLWILNQSCTYTFVHVEILKPNWLHTLTHITLFTWTLHCLFCWCLLRTIQFIKDFTCMKPTKILPCFFKDNIISLTSVNDNSIIFEVTFRSIYQGFWYYCIHVR